jgi:hypothetical protein
MSDDRKCVELKVDGGNSTAVVDVRGVAELSMRVGDDYIQADVNYDCQMLVERWVVGSDQYSSVSFNTSPNIHYGGTGWWILDDQDEDDLLDQIKDEHFG